MLKRNRTFVVKILFFFIVYYAVTLIISQTSQLNSSSQEQEEDSVTGVAKKQHKEDPLEPPEELNKEFFDKADQIYDDRVPLNDKDVNIAEPPQKPPVKEKVIEQDDDAIPFIKQKEDIKEDDDIPPRYRDKDIVPEPEAKINVEEKVGVDKNEKLPDSADKKEEVADKVERHVEKLADDKAAAEQNMALMPPQKPDGPGELGKPYKVDKNSVDEETKKKIDDGWTRNAFNEYVSDLISVHRCVLYQNQ